MQTETQYFVCTSNHEMWRPVVGWEGQYEVSSLGRVRSLLHGNKKYLMRQQQDRYGYMNVPLTTTRKYQRKDRPWPRTRSQQCKIHRLVLEAFVGPCPEEMEGLHFNDIQTDNQLENLRWGTCEENLRDRKRNNNGD